MPQAQDTPGANPSSPSGAGTTAAAREPAAPGANAAPATASAPQPLTEGAALASIVGKDQALGDIAQPLATKLATGSKTQTDFDSQYADVGVLRHDAIAAFLDGGQARSATQTVGLPDPIAVQKFADIDGEAHLSDAGLKDKFYLNLVTEMKKPSFTDRTRTYDAIKAAAPPAEFGFKGNPIPPERITPLSSRNQSVDKLYDINTIAPEIDAAIEQPLVAAHARADTIATHKADRALRLKAYRHLIAARDPLTTVDKGQPISKYAAWYAPGEISVPPGDNTTNYARMMRLGALQPEWYPNGTVVLNIDRTLQAGARDIRKPTAFDGLMSVLWVSRNLSEDDYGVTGGGLGEFLEKGVTYNEVTSATAVIPSDDFLADIARVTSQVSTAQPGSTPMEEVARGNGANTSILNTAPEVGGMYNDIAARSQREGQDPSAAPVAPGAAQPTSASMPASAGPRQVPTPAPAPAATAPAHTTATPAPAPAAAEALAAAAPAAVAPSAAVPAPQAAQVQTPAAPAAGAAGPAAQGPQAPSPVGASGSPVGASGSPVGAGAVPAVAPDATSRHAAGDAPAGWESHVVDRIPASEVAADDPGHTYHLLDDGRAVATSTPRLLPQTIAAQVANKLRHFNGKDTAARKTEVDADVAKVRVAPDLPAYATMVDSLSILASPRSRAQVNLRVGKLTAAIGRARAAIPAKYGPVIGAQKVKEWIDDRLPLYLANANTKFQSEATAKALKLTTEPTVKEEHQVDAAWCMVNYNPAASGPEEPATPAMIDASGGIMKVYDVGAAFTSGMIRAVQDLWVGVYGSKDAARDAFVTAAKAAGALVALPASLASDPTLAHHTPPTVFVNPINGFVGQGKDATGVTSFSVAIQRFALNPGYYPSGAMFACTAPATEVKAEMAAPGGAKIGKPSLFNLLHFDENVYDENDRSYGHLADPTNPHAAGSALELTCLGYPGRDFWGKATLLR